MKKSLLHRSAKIARKFNNERHPEWGNFHHYSFVVQSNKLIEWATNRAGPPHTRLGYPAYGKQHSETLAYAKAKGILARTTSFEIINLRLNKKGDFRMSRPCACCFAFLDNLNCRAVWFSTDYGFAKLNF